MDPAEAPPSADVVPEKTQRDPTWIYLLGRGLSYGAMCLWNRVRVEGRDRIPREGGLLVVANHQSYLDISLVAGALRRHVVFVARDTLQRSRFIGWIMRGSGAILIHRGAADRAALRAIVQSLKKGCIVAIYPEGTRTQDGSLGQFRGGALFAARRAGVPVLPVGIRGAFEAFPRHARFPRPRRIGVRIGEPIDPGGDDALERVWQSVQDLIGDGRFASLPPIP